MIEREKVLVVYFSWSGNTRKIALQIHKQMGGDIFEIQPISDYSSIYNDVLDRAKQEIRSGNKPKLKELIESIERYDIVFIGYPNWYNTFPAMVLTFLSEHDFTGKTIIPFCTHGGGGFGHSVSDIAKQCHGAEVLDGFSINGYSVSENNAEVAKWLGKVFKTAF